MVSDCTKLPGQITKALPELSYPSYTLQSNPGVGVGGGGPARAKVAVLVFAK